MTSYLLGAWFYAVVMIKKIKEQFLHKMYIEEVRILVPTLISRFEELCRAEQVHRSHLKVIVVIQE